MTSGACERPHGGARATAAGVAAILLWAALALLTVAAKGVPPFELMALGFTVACVVGLAVLAWRGAGALAALRQPIAPWLTAFLALFLYHALYFYALANVPPARASLIAYLWPLLIVLLAAAAPGGARLRWQHVCGALLGLVGAATLFLDKRGATTGAGAPTGYAAAFGCALVWSGYSVTNRRFAAVPSEMLIGVCGVVAAAAALAHLAVETSVWPDTRQGLAIIGLGVGPTGLAFLAWDHATKHGNLPLIGALSYLAPLVSTLLLVASGLAPATPLVALAALLIVAGATLASLMSRRPS